MLKLIKLIEKHGTSRKYLKAKRDQASLRVIATGRQSRLRKAMSQKIVILSRLPRLSLGLRTWRISGLDQRWLAHCAEYHPSKKQDELTTLDKFRSWSLEQILSTCKLIYWAHFSIPLRWTKAQVPFKVTTWHQNVKEQLPSPRQPREKIHFA